MMIDEKDLINDLKRVKGIINRIPSSQIYNEEGKYHPSTFDRKFGSWNNALRVTFGKVLQNSPQKRIEKKCLNCEEITLNPKFCSATCAAIYNNKARGIHSSVFCDCGKKIHYDAKSCPKCRTLNLINEFGNKTLGEFRKLPAIAKNRYVPVRQHAARVMKYHNLVRDNCLLCDYSNHVQLCHIKDIGDFSDDATLNEVNNITNLVYLCPNHHWDLDHEYLSREELSTIKSYLLIVELSS